MDRDFYDRRRGPDLLVKWVNWSGTISWLLVITSLLISIGAKPQVETFLDRLFNIKLKSTWNFQLLQYSFIVLVLLFVFCCISLLINALRCRRKSDRFNKSIIFNTIISCIGIAVYMLFIL